ncbi:MAG TPA: AI-2E family transporter, partial [Firmicutes bacterium]|nr:AI-2E family transporter [Bacillota bacterium]
MNNSIYKKILVLLTVVLAVVFIFFRLHQLKLVYTVMLPFVAAFIIAYVLNPIVTYLEKQKLSRSLAVMVIFFIFFGSIAFLAFNIIPAVVGEIQDLIAALPDYTIRLQEYLQDMQRHYHRFNMPENL